MAHGTDGRKERHHPTRKCWKRWVANTRREEPKFWCWWDDALKEWRGKSFANECGNRLCPGDRDNRGPTRRQESPTLESLMLPKGSPLASKMTLAAEAARPATAGEMAYRRSQLWLTCFCH